MVAAGVAGPHIQVGAADGGGGANDFDKLALIWIDR
jgi:hypothetical protein